MIDAMIALYLPRIRAKAQNPNSQLQATPCDLALLSFLVAVVVRMWLVARAVTDRL